MDVDQLFNQHKPLMFTIAYQMLGSVQDAEDIVQDVYLQLKEAPITSIKHPKSYLIKMVSNKSLNLLQSARSKREVYVGPWLPEPLVENVSDAPLDKIIKEESISYAFTVILHRLTDLERCVFLLRETLAFDYETISSILNRSEQSLRKVYSRARQKIKNENVEMKRITNKEEQFIRLFIRGVETGDFDAFIKKLTENVILTTDGGGKALAALRPIFGKNRVVSFLKGLYSKGSLDGKFELITINGGYGMIHKRDGKPINVIILDIHGNQIQNIFCVLNPEKIMK